ncbi:RAD52 motif-containing protein 1 [Leucoraja erinacea]|uniref:RAD52 motif-containing protein 1 n=1 Tax=Leucoraja erinaceus TaxID=7782 RepID=UPI0024573165|nr:RAD52 motif-containing protein 1 [Leucoraja erinacea]
MALAAAAGSPVQAEVVQFKVPSGNSKTLFVCNIPPKLSEAAVYSCIFNTFSEHGLVYFLRVSRNAVVAQPGYYAVVKYYSALSASRAQTATNEQCLFQEIPLKVRMCTKQRFWKEFQDHQLSLNSIKCQELANYYLGFNGWSSHIIGLQKISGTDGCEESAQEMEQSERKSIKYLCIMEIKFKNYDMCCRGIGVSEVLETQDATDPLNYALLLGRTQKSAMQKALSDAFQKVVLVVLGNGKVSLQWSSEQDEVDHFTEEELQTQLQVNNISWSQFEHEGQEEILSDLSFNADSMGGIGT